MFRRLENFERGPAVTVHVDGRPVMAREGETIATVLLLSGMDTMRQTLLSGSPRGFFCGMGICCECLVELGDGSRVKACQTRIEPGMRIFTRTSSGAQKT